MPEGSSLHTAPPLPPNPCHAISLPSLPHPFPVFPCNVTLLTGFLCLGCSSPNPLPGWFGSNSSFTPSGRPFLIHDLLVFVLSLSHSTQFSWVTVFVTICNCITVVIDGEGNGTPLQHSCLENPMGGGAWCAAVHGVARSRTRPSDFFSL